MPAPTRTERSAWIDAGLRALADGGPDAIRVEALARALGVTKGGFYWHFADRATFVEEMLDTWERRVVDEVITEVDGAGGSPRDRLRALLDRAAGDEDFLRTELAVSDWARRDPGVAQRQRRLDDRRMAYLRELFAPLCADEAEAEARSLMVLTLLLGSRFVAADHGPRTRAEVVASALRLLLR